MKKFYYSLTENKRILFWIILSEFGAVILSSFCFFVGRYDIPLGIILGSIIAVCNYLIISKQTLGYLKGKKTVAKSIFYYMIRFVIYAIGLTIAIAFELYLFPLFEVFAVLGAYILSKVVLVIYGLKERG